MHKTLSIPPPAEYLTFSPSELFRFFFQIGRWTEDSFSADFQNYTRGKLISTVTINKWKNRDVIPRRYSGPLFKMIEDQFEPDIAMNWIAAFETVWATHIARPDRSSKISKAKNFSDIICRQHSNWIKTRYEENLSGERFSASDIYVPLQLIERSADGGTLYDVEDILDHFTTGIPGGELQEWTFICGGPGSGKSMAAMHLAYEICETSLFPIYLRGSHLSDIDIDIQNANQPVIDSFSIKSFLQHFRASSQNTACLILDGLDEIAGTATEATTALRQILTELSLERNVCRAHGKKLHIIAFGRQSHVKFASGLIPAETSLHLNMLGLDGRDQHVHSTTIFGRDFRADWWEKFLAATEKQYDPVLPDFLSSDFDDYSEFGSEPLLTFLICRLALEGHDSSSKILPHEAVNALTYAKNKNEIYRQIIEHIHARTRVEKGQPLALRDFSSVLQRIALTNWHSGDKRTVSVKNIQDQIFDERTAAAFESLKLNAPELLITAFYYRLSKESGEGDRAAIEFTHKTFSEYLVATLIFDRFEQLITAFSAQDGLDEAIENWASLSRAGAHEPSLAAFCQNEAKLRYARFSNLNWDAALTLLRDHLVVTTSGKYGLETITQTQRAMNLCLFIWSCLNLERQRRTGSHFKLFEPLNQFGPLDLKRLQLPNALNFKTGSLTEPQLHHQTFLTQSLSALEFEAADLSQLSFSIGHMQSLNCRQSSFAMTHWSHVKISTSTFQKTVFQHAIFHGARWSDSDFSNCLFQAVKIQLSSFSQCRIKNTIFSQCHFSDVDFVSTEMTGVIFDRCTFINCSFNAPLDAVQTNTITFRVCSFLDMESTLEKNTDQKFEQCIFQAGLHKNDGLEKKQNLESQIGKLLI